MRSGRRSDTRPGRCSGALPVLAVLPVALLAAACTGSGTTAGGTSTATPTTSVTTTGSASSSVPADPAVAWADKVCGEVVKVTESQNGTPPNLANSDTAQTVREFQAYVQANLDALARAIDNVRDAGPAPIAGADQAMSALLNGLDVLKRTYQAVKDKLGAINANDQQAAQSAVLEAFTGISRAGEQLGQAANSLSSNQELADAAKRAPSCQKLQASAVPTTTTTS